MVSKIMLDPQEQRLESSCRSPDVKPGKEMREVAVEVFNPVSARLRDVLVVFACLVFLRD